MTRASHNGVTWSARNSRDGASVHRIPFFCLELFDHFFFFWKLIIQMTDRCLGATINKGLMFWRVAHVQIYARPNISWAHNWSHHNVTLNTYSNLRMFHTEMNLIQSYWRFTRTQMPRHFCELKCARYWRRVNVRASEMDRRNGQCIMASKGDKYTYWFKSLWMVFN